MCGTDNYFPKKSDSVMLVLKLLNFVCEKKWIRLIKYDFSCFKQVVKWTIFVLGIFTWRWGTQDRWGNPLRWGNPPIHIISHFNLITFAWNVGWPATAGLPHLPGVPHLHVTKPLIRVGVWRPRCLASVPQGKKSPIFPEGRGCYASYR